jgi:hypothetical protein
MDLGEAAPLSILRLDVDQSGIVLGLGQQKFWIVVVNLLRRLVYGKNTLLVYNQLLTVILKHKWLCRGVKLAAFGGSNGSSAWCGSLEASAIVLGLPIIKLLVNESGSPPKVDVSRIPSVL